MSCRCNPGLPREFRWHFERPSHCSLALYFVLQFQFVIFALSPAFSFVFSYSSFRSLMFPLLSLILCLQWIFLLICLLFTAALHFFFHISFHPSIHSNLGNQILPHHSSCIRYHIIAEWKHLYRLSILAHIKQNKITKKKSHLCKKSLYVVFFPKWGS